MNNDSNLKHTFHKSILRAYDIRGIYNETLFDNDAYFLGKSFAGFLKKNYQNKIAIACDGRLSSPILKERLLQGLVNSGLYVFDVGLGPTPMLYFAVNHLNCDAGIMITGSHNPGNHNGFKITLKDRPFYGKDIANLALILEDADFYEGQGVLEIHDIKQNYAERILQDSILQKGESELLNEVDEFNPRKKLKIAWDAGNGAGGEIMEILSENIFAENFLLFKEIDGTFPNHHPDPTVPKNLEDLIAEVKKHNCDLGIAFDGDADRIGVVDDEGEIIWGDQLMVFFAREILANHPNSTIIADVKASNILFDEIKKSGGKPLMWKTGHSLIKAKMKETNALLAGEMSGHIFFADKYFGFDDALYSAIRLINIVANSDKKLSELRKELVKTFSTPEIRVECSEENKFQMVEDLKKILQKNNEKFDDIDGIRSTTEIGWWLIRASNTQPVLVARCEADSLENLQILKNNLRQKLEFCQLTIPEELQ
jgi:phosphomannomutase